MDIRNFVEIDDSLATAGQPTEAQLGALRERGFEVVVNLGLHDADYSLPDEAGAVGALGMSYHHIPVAFQSPLLADFERFEEVMRGARGRKVFVHCAMNFRVSCFTALYGEANLGWSREQADAHVRRLWQPNEVWSAFLDTVRAAREFGGT